MFKDATGNEIKVDGVLSSKYSDALIRCIRIIEIDAKHIQGIFIRLSDYYVFPISQSVMLKSEWRVKVFKDANGKVIKNGDKLRSLNSDIIYEVIDIEKEKLELCTGECIVVNVTQYNINFLKMCLIYNERTFVMNSKNLKSQINDVIKPDDKPKRVLIINDEDVINLKIALNSSKTLEEFLKVV